MDKIVIDVRDLDYSWFEDVPAFVDRAFDRYLLPRASVERLGEIRPDGDADLLDGRVTARAEEAEIDGRMQQLWAVGSAALVTRPSMNRRRGGGRGR